MSISILSPPPPPPPLLNPASPKMYSKHSTTEHTNAVVILSASYAQEYDGACGRVEARKFPGSFKLFELCQQHHVLGHYNACDVSAISSPGELIFYCQLLSEELFELGSYSGGRKELFGRGVIFRCHRFFSDETIFKLKICKLTKPFHKTL